MYAETEKKLNALRGHDELLFRMAIAHLMDVGIRHLTEEKIESTCEGIMQEDDSHKFMTNEYACSIVRMAGEIAKLDHIEVLCYIQRKVAYDIHDGIFPTIIPQQFEAFVSHVEWEAENSAIYKDLKAAGLSNAEIRYINYGYVIPEEDEDDE